LGPGALRPDNRLFLPVNRFFLSRRASLDLLSVSAATWFGSPGHPADSSIGGSIVFKEVRESGLWLANHSGIEIGSSLFPFNTELEGVQVVLPGGNIHICRRLSGGDHRPSTDGPENNRGTGDDRTSTALVGADREHASSALAPRRSTGG
jgi:hypothetical protein